MSLRNGYYIGDAPRFRFDPIFADRNMHISGISLQGLNGAQADQILSSLRFERIPTIALNAAAHKSIFKATRVVLLRLDHLARQFDALEPFVGVEAVDIDDAGVHQDAHGVTVGSIGVGSIDTPLQQFRVMLFDVFRSDDDFDLS